MAVVLRDAAILWIFLVVVAGAEPTTDMSSTYRIKKTTDTTESTSKKIADNEEPTSILRSIVNVSLAYVHDLEDIYFINVEVLERRLLNHTRSIEEFISPYNSAFRLVDIQEVHARQMENIRTAIRLLEDEFWTFKSHEPQFRSKLRKIDDTVRAFSKTVKDEIKLSQTPTTTTESSPVRYEPIRNREFSNFESYYYPTTRNYYPARSTSLGSTTKATTESVAETEWTISRKLKDETERTVRTLQENLQRRSQEFQDSCTRFVRGLEDNIFATADMSLSGPEGSVNAQFRYIVKQAYALKKRTNSQLAVFLQSMESRIAQFEEALEFQISKLLETADVLEELRYLVR